MRIGVITLWNSDDNYGQQMQLYALQRYLRFQGHDAFLIRYDPSFKRILKEKIVIVTKRIVKICLGSIIPSFRYKMKKDIELSKTLEKNKFDNQKRDFRKFRAEHVVMSEIVYTSYKQLKNNPPFADVYISGSDQVWHYSVRGKKAAGYFLQFGDKKSKRISYAASIGREIVENEIPLLKKWIDTFDAVSVREESALQLCRKVGRTDAITAIDPTCLLPVNHYLKMVQAPSIHCHPYLFMYILNVDKKEDTGWPEVEPYIKEYGLEIKTVASSGYEPARELIPNNKNILATIPQWLGLIHSSEAVVTTSFHGMVFSILFHKKFVVVLLPSNRSHANTRITNFLSLLGLSQRILDSTKPFKSQMDSPIDWEVVDVTIDGLRRKGCRFLECAIKGNNGSSIDTDNCL